MLCPGPISIPKGGSVGGGAVIVNVNVGEIVGSTLTSKDKAGVIKFSPPSLLP